MPVAIRSKTCHVQDVEQKSGKANCLLGCAMSAAERAPVWGRGRKFYVVLCRQVSAGGGLGCQRASPPAEGRFGFGVARRGGCCTAGKMLGLQRRGEVTPSLAARSWGGGCWVFEC